MIFDVFRVTWSQDASHDGRTVLVVRGTDRPLRVDVRDADGQAGWGRSELQKAQGPLPAIAGHCRPLPFDTHTHTHIHTHTQALLPPRVGRPSSYQER